MIKAIVFDFDHVLYNRNLTIAHMSEPFLHTFHKALRSNITLTEVVTAMQSADSAGVYRGGTPGIYHMLVASGIFKVPPGYDEYFSFLLSEMPHAIQPYPDTYTTLSWCRAQGLGPAILTNGSVEYQMRKINALCLKDYAQPIIVAITTGYEKPNAIPFLEIAKQLDVAPAEMIYVGDNPINDIAGARSAGILPIWFRSVDIWNNDLPPAPYSIKRLSELPALVTAIQAQAE